MIKKVVFFFLFLPIFAFGQERINLIGNVFDGITFFPISGANIYNFNSKMYSFTNKEGKFEISVHIGDTIIVSKPVYKQEMVIITPETAKNGKLEISLFYKAIILKEVNVYALPATYGKFKEEFLNTVFSNIYMEIEGINLTMEEKLANKYPNTFPGQINLLNFIPEGTNPITALYNKFSKKKKIEKQYLELVANQEEVNNLPLKYNKELITSLTGLRGEDLLDFMIFCKFSYYDLVRWSSEFIVTQIKNRFDEYEFYKATQN